MFFLSACIYWIVVLPYILCGCLSDIGRRHGNTSLFTGFSFFAGSLAALVLLGFAVWSFFMAHNQNKAVIYVVSAVVSAILAIYIDLRSCNLDRVQCSKLDVWLSIMIRMLVIVVIIYALSS